MRILSLPVNLVKVSIRSKRSLLLAVGAMSIVALSFVVPHFALSRSSASSLISAKPKRQYGDQPTTLRRMIGAYYRTGEGWKSTLTLNNKGSDPIAVTLTLYSQSGQSFTPPAVSVDGLSPLEVDLNALAKTAGPQFKEGSVEFSYTGKLLEMGGGLRIINAEKSLIFDEQMLEPGMKFSASQLESVFAVPYESAQVDLILTNATANLLVIDGQATFAGNPVRLPIPFALAPHQSRTFTLPHGLLRRAKAGAVSLKHNGDKGALLAMLHIREEGRGFSATGNFSNYATGQTTSLHGAGLRLGNVNGGALKPVVVVRNTEENPATVIARIPYTKTDQSSGVVTLPQLTLGPGEIGFLDTSSPQLRKSDLDTAGLEIEYTGIPGGVIASAYSISASGNHVFALPLKDPKGGLSSTGGYPWFINETSSAVVFIKNTTTEPQRFTLDIIYPGGQWGSNLRTLAPGQTFKLDVREIRDSQRKGSEGNTIPLDATIGHVSWSAYGKDSHKTLIGRSQTVDITNGLISTYECQRCCGNSIANSRVIPGSVAGFVGDTQQFIAQEQDWDCYHEHISSWFNVGGVPVTWGSDNTNVATCDSNGLGTAVGAGSTRIWASWPGLFWFADEAQGCMADDIGAGGEAMCEVADFTISGAANCRDGSSANFSVTVTGGTAQSYQWSFEAPSEAGNNPNVEFGSPSSDSTSAKCHWFAKPNHECNAPCVSTYTIKCEVTFQGGQRKTRNTSLSVDGCWNPAGFVDPNVARVTGAPDMAADTNGVWRVTGMGNLGRQIPPKVIIVPTSSQFYNKTDVHETEHHDHWQPGNLLGNLHNPADFFARIRNFTGTSQNDLVTKLGAELTTYTNEQGAIFEQNRNETEKRAHAKSDPVTPRYLYQNCGRY